MDLSGDPQICLIGLIGFQRARRERQRLTLTRLLRRHQGSAAGDRKRARQARKINVKKKENI